MLSTPRAITLDDLFGDAGAAKGTNSLIETMRQSHHALARLVAEGRKDVEIAAMTGFSQSRISILKSSPAFQELITHYSEVKEAAYVDTHEKIALLGNEALDALRDDLHDEKLSPSQKIELAKLALDRSGHGPQSKSTNINLNAPLEGEALAALRAAVPQSGRIKHLADIEQAAGTSVLGAAPLLSGPAIPHEVSAGEEPPVGPAHGTSGEHSQESSSRREGQGTLV